MAPERVATLTIAPELRPYSALNVELSTLNSDTVLIDGWNVTCEFDRSFRLMPLTMKFTDVSRLPAVMNENEPWPRSGALRPPFCGGVTAAGHQRTEVDEVPAVQRNLLHGAFGHRPGRPTTVAVSMSGDGAGDGDVLGERADARASG